MLASPREGKLSLAAAWVSQEVFDNADWPLLFPMETQWGIETLPG